MIRFLKPIIIRHNAQKLKRFLYVDQIGDLEQIYFRPLF